MTVTICDASDKKQASAENRLEKSSGTEQNRVVAERLKDLGRLVRVPSGAPTEANAVPARGVGPLARRRAH